VTGAAPKVSVIIANHNGALHLAEALHSVLTQTLADLEVIVVDDASTDGSVALIRRAAAQDARVRWVARTQQGGPSAARNDALALARGAWIAVVDGDDFLARDRLARLIAMAEADAADIACDDMVAFAEDASMSPRRILAGRYTSSPQWVTATTYVDANRLTGTSVPLGYLKPIIRREALASAAVTYDENLRIAEDYDLILRLLIGGCRMRVYPTSGYFYRRHSASISHRLPPGALAAMLWADSRLRSWAGERLTPDLQQALDRRVASIHAVATVEPAMQALKSLEIGRVVTLLRGSPRAIAPWLAVLAKAATARLRRPFARGGRDSRPMIRVISRQRINPRGNGSSAYLLTLCRALREAGFDLHLISPTPSTFGRVPVIPVGELATVFTRMDFRGGVRFGNFLIAIDPKVFVTAALGIMGRTLSRIGVPIPASWQRPAPYVMALPWTAEDLLFVARQSQGNTQAVIADYVFCLPAAAFAMAPLQPTAVIMHDLLSARAENFQHAGANDSVAQLDAEAEADLLRRADLVIAIQAQEGEVVRQMVPGQTKVVVAPMSQPALPAAQPGEGAGLLFVGSGTAPNVDGMRWFLAEVWPLIRAQRPDASLSVAGLVCGKLGAEGQVPGVSLLGRVPDLAGLYRRADVVIAPLRAGSGLKIKLIEALAAGKAIVASPVTLQGVEHLLQDAVLRADTAEEFASAVLNLLGDASRRAALAERALDAAAEHFGFEAAAAPFVAALRQSLARNPLLAEEVTA
jgi:succinoglycan biosynthesis protein ExoO